MSVSQNHLRIARFFLFVTFTAWVVTGCKDTSTPVPEGNRYLIDATFAGELSRQQIQVIAAGVNPLLSAVVTSGVKLYKVRYKTVNVDGSEIEASGAVAFPEGERSFPMLSVQHGTITAEEDAPSNLVPGSDFMSYGGLFGSLGYIAVFPDYIGYGSSKHLPHPYEHRESLGRASLDMLRAVKEMINGDAYMRWNNKLYISGFSEGGFATLSLQKMLEEDAKDEFDLRASTCGAGAYNKTAFMKYLVNNETHGDAGYNRLYAWVLQSYNWIYKVDLPMSHFFTEPYATAVAQPAPGNTLGVSFNQMLQPAFVQGLNDGTEAKLIAAIADNDLLDWKPVTPTQLYHGTADELVFSFNSETAYESMKAKGATELELIMLPGRTHTSAVLDYLMGTYTFFSSKP